MWLNSSKKAKKIIYNFNENDWTELCPEMFNVYAHVYENFENKKKTVEILKSLKNPILHVADNLVTNKICTFHQIGELYVDAMLNLARQVY